MNEKPHYIKCGPYIEPRDWRSLPTSKLTRAERVMRFSEKWLKIPEGKDVGKPLHLYPFQEAFIYSVLDNPAGTRKAILSMARKNGKSALISCLLLSYIFGPEAVKNSQIVSGALSKEQASLIFKLARKMIVQIPDWSDHVNIIPSQKILEGKALGVDYKSLASEGSTTMGISPIVILSDESGQIIGPTSDFISALETSQGAYDNPLFVHLSTQAPTDNDLLSREIDGAISSQDPHTVCHVYAADPDCDLMDREQWKKANPALGIFRSEKDLEEQLKEALNMPSKENAARNLLLNQRISMDSPFVSKAVWQSNGDKPASLRGKKVYGGLDLSSVSDLTGLVLEDVEGNLEVRAWLPKEGIIEKAKADRVPYDVWAREGLLTLTPGKAIEYEWVAHELRRVFNEYDVQQINFDRYNMKFLRPWLEKAGFTAKELEKFNEFGQGVVSMSPALRALESSLLQGQIKHGNHPILTMCMGNCVVEHDAAGNRKFTKKKSTGRIDLAVCLAMAEDARSAHKEKANTEWSIHII